MSFFYGENNNENFCNNGYVLFNGPLCPPSPRATSFEINGIDTGLSGNDILEYVFGVGLCKNNIINEICHGMINDT